MLPNNIVIADAPGQALADYLADQHFSQLAVLVDENTLQHCYPLVKAHLPQHLVVEIVSGEANKTLDTCQVIWQQLTDAGFDRKGLLINLGGGVIGDMGGFCAATYKRGFSFVNVPTTLLAQVDASVGGKLGIDFGALKNHIGLFRIPDLVLISAQFLNTLSNRELRSGFAEVLKHGLIADAAYWHKVTQRPFDAQNWAAIIPDSVAIKQQVVEADPTEKGLRKILNYGHTLGHAVESFYLNRPGQRLLHGEAIAVGMLSEGWLSVQHAGLPQTALEAIEQYVLATYHDLPAIDNEFLEAIVALTLHDKKNQGGKVNFSLLNAIGQCAYDVVVPEGDMAAALRYYNKVRGEAAE